MRQPIRSVLWPSQRSHGLSNGSSLFASCSRNERRYIQLDHRNRLSKIWVPAPHVSLKDAKHDEESHAKLMRAGFFRQAHSGVFHMLPLGLRVQDKIEALVDKHMKAIGGSRVSLSSISSQKLWARSGRLESVKSELFQFADRKEAKYLLSPTHEEEITELVSQNVRSYRGLPLRLYQITRKYRDEMRPRHGILRSREFIMKDMYSFDLTVEDAMATYAQVRAAYAAIFAAMKVPVLAARASSGDMGGDLSHEYHLAASLGEDYVAHCSSCDYAANTEVLEASAAAQEQTEQSHSLLAVKYVKAWRGITRDRQTLINVWYPAESVNKETGETVRMTDDDIDTHAIKAVVPDLDSSIENTVAAWNGVFSKIKAAEAAALPQKPKLLNLVDRRLLGSEVDVNIFQWPVFGTTAMPPPTDVEKFFDVEPVTTVDSHGRSFNFTKPRTGDDCPRCQGHSTLIVERAIELGHTFYLGTRYTSPEALDVKVQAPVAESGKESSQQTAVVPVMGCYGLGISRILGAVADLRADRKGLNWPRTIAPYEVVVVVAPPKGTSSATPIDGKDEMAGVAEGVYDELAQNTLSGPGLDVLLDDRTGATLPYKLKDADLTGYPVIVVVGNAWRQSVDPDYSNEGSKLPLDGLCEVQCRQLGVKQNVPLRDLRTFVSQLLDQL